MRNLIVVGYPKSGNTWLDFLLAHYLGARFIDLSMEEAYLSGSSDAPPDYWKRDKIQGGSVQSSGSETKVNQIEVVAKTHKRPDQISDAFPNSVEKYGLVERTTALIVRDPRDVAVSYFHYQHHRRHMRNNTRFYRYTPYFARDLYFKWRYLHDFAMNVAEEWRDFVTHCLPFVDVVVRCEDLLDDEIQQIQHIAAKLDLPFRPFAAEEAANYCSFDNMRKREQNQSMGSRAQEGERFFRKGKSEQWQNYLNSSTLQSFVERAEPAMSELGYD
jgi:hypothetical protein